MAVGGNTLMSAPVSAISSSAVRLSTPGIVSSSATFCAKRGDHLIDLSRQLGDRLIEEVDARELPADDQGMMAGEATLERLSQRGELLG